MNAGPRVLVVNAGSSSLKLRVIVGEQVVASRDVPAGPEEPAAVADFVAQNRPDAVGHRVVHGGHRWTAPVRIDDEVLAGLRELTDLAPLHQPGSLAGIDVVRAARPELPAVACFDTAFHADLPDAAATYALPAQWRERWGLRRFGFHGLSHAYAARRAPVLAGRETNGCRTVVCHLGAGVSLCAVRDGRSMDTTMGFTPLDGLVMATRSGSVDPGLLLWLQRHGGLDVSEIADALERRSGLLGLGGSADLRELLAAEAAGSAGAALAIETYVHRLAAGIAAMSAALGGLDVLVFTGGVGENADAIRARACHRLGFIGVHLDEVRNAAARADAQIGGLGARVDTVVLTAREDLEVHRGVLALL